MSLLRYKDDPFVYNMNNGPVFPAVLMSLLLHSSLKWRMNAAQLLSLQQMSSFMGEHVELANEAETTEIMTRNIPHTLCGIPVELRDDYPRNVIALVQGEKALGMLELLAVPMAMSRFDDEEEERRKWKSLTM